MHLVTARSDYYIFELNSNYEFFFKRDKNPKSSRSSFIGFLDKKGQEFVAPLSMKDDANVLCTLRGYSRLRLVDPTILQRRFETLIIVE